MDDDHKLRGYARLTYSPCVAPLSLFPNRFCASFSSVLQTRICLSQVQVRVEIVRLNSDQPQPDVENVALDVGAAVRKEPCNKGRIRLPE
jgi:hypothetical protein